MASVGVDLRCNTSRAGLVCSCSEVRRGRRVGGVGCRKSRERIRPPAASIRATGHRDEIGRGVRFKNDDRGYQATWRTYAWSTPALRPQLLVLAQRSADLAGVRRSSPTRRDQLCPAQAGPAIARVRARSRNSRRRTGRRAPTGDWWFCQLGRRASRTSLLRFPTAPGGDRRSARGGCEGVCQFFVQ